MGPLWPLIVIYIIHQMLLGEFKWELMFVCGFSLRFPCHSQTHSLPIATIGTLIPLEQWLKTAFLLPSLRTRGQSNFKINPWKKKKLHQCWLFLKDCQLPPPRFPERKAAWFNWAPIKGHSLGKSARAWTWIHSALIWAGLWEPTQYSSAVPGHITAC